MSCGKKIVFAPPHEEKKKVQKPKTDPDTQKTTFRNVTKRVKVFDPAYLQQHPYCPDDDDCRSKWQNRVPFLFKVPSDAKPPASAEDMGAELLKTVVKLGSGQLDDKTMGRLMEVSKDMRRTTLPQFVRDSRKSATHYDKNDAQGTPIDEDAMLEIALLAYQGAIELKAAHPPKPVILYRVADKGVLTDEEKLQTLSGRIRVKIANGSDWKEVWPLEKTAAWIQGALRAQSRFLLLTDPRGNLTGGQDGLSDAIYVRELYQILDTHYKIDKANDDERTTRMKADKVHPFVLVPLGKASPPLKLVPRMIEAMKTDGWNGTVKDLQVNGGTLVRSVLEQKFIEAGKSLGVPQY